MTLVTNDTGRTFVANNLNEHNVVNSAKGDPSFGENSALYASFGYIRKSDRKSGLTRAAKAAASQPELKIAA